MASMNGLNKRILKEIEIGYQSSNFDFFFDSDGKYGEPNACYVRFMIKTGIYLGQTHILKIKFIYGYNQPYVYPKDAPNVLFLTPIFHTNIAVGGAICLDVLKSEWSPMYGIEAIFNSILALLEDPNTKSPFNSDAAKLYNEHEKTPSIYKKICQEYYLKQMETNEHANKLIHSNDFRKNS